MSTFVLIHGAWYGAWCWNRLRPELDGLGHRTIAMDLPVGDASATFADYAAAVLSSYDADAIDVVLVGHSLGAMVLPLVAAERPAVLAVSVCGVIPNVDGMPWDHAPQMGRNRAYDTVVGDDGSIVFNSLESATFTFFGDCTPADARWAFERLRPQNSTSLWDRIYPLDRIPDTPRAAIACVDDAAITIDYSRAVTGPRLGVDLIELPGAHSPFISRPAALAVVLDGLAREAAPTPANPA
jgi:pimeloyl-ACP methyl ester carboxylesterase